MSEQEIEIQDGNQVTQTPSSPLSLLRRLGCGLMLVIWFGILSIPGAMFWLATGGDIRIPHGNIPDSEQHPLFQVNLIMDTDNRGLQFSRTSIQNIDDLSLCVQGNVSYLLWESDGTATPATYCQCYERANSEADWVFTTQALEACNS